MDLYDWDVLEKIKAERDKYKELCEGYQGDIRRGIVVLRALRDRVEELELEKAANSTLCLTCLDNESLATCLEALLLKAMEERKEMRYAKRVLEDKLDDVLSESRFNDRD